MKLRLDSPAACVTAIKWTLIGVLYAALAVAAALTDLHLPPLEVAGLAALTAPVALLMLMARRHGWTRTAMGLTGLLEYGFLGLGLTALASIAAVSGRPIVDEPLRQIDAWMGFDVPRLVQFSSRGWWGIVLEVAYYTVLAQTALALLVHTWTEDRRAFACLTLQLIFAAIMTVAMFAWFPAAGPFAGGGEDLQPDVFQQHYLDWFRGLRSGADRGIHFWILTGLITFPSFHAAWALILIATYRRYPAAMAAAAVLNAMVLISTVTTGWHYVFDVVAGLMIGLIAIGAAAWVWRGCAACTVKIPCPSPSS